MNTSASVDKSSFSRNKCIRNLIFVVLVLYLARIGVWYYMFRTIL